jgi:hypothetical protein
MTILFIQRQSTVQRQLGIAEAGTADGFPVRTVTAAPNQLGSPLEVDRAAEAVQDHDAERGAAGSIVEGARFFIQRPRFFEVAWYSVPVFVSVAERGAGAPDAVLMAGTHQLRHHPGGFTTIIKLLGAQCAGARS